MLNRYLDFQSAVGITKHTGGPGATRELLAMCGVDQATAVLEVGCGIGVGPANLARAHDCRVVGVDRSDQMIEWSRRRAREHGVADRVELLVADATSLPFEDGAFDIAIAESVLAFVDDKPKALREMVRVVRAGGHVGINESIWTGELPPDVAKLARDLDVEVESAVTWTSLCEQAGLHDLVVRLRRIDAGVEVRNRLRWVGLPWAVRAWGRTIALYATQPEVRHDVQAFYGSGLAVFDYVGYGLFVGTV